MLHLFSGDEPWFGEKRYGFGAGLPIAWQGWALLLSYISVMIGLGAVAERARGEALVGVIAGMLLASVAIVAIARARTRGGWHWRWGEDD